VIPGGYFDIRVFHRSRKGKKDPRFLFKCGCCQEKLEVYYGGDSLEINGIMGSVENWRQLLLPLLNVRVPGAIFLCAAALAAQTPPVVFLEPDGQDFRRVTDAAAVSKYTRWLDNEPARWALDLYARTHKISGGRHPKELYIALVPGGNHADCGFKLKSETSVEDHSKTAYVKLGPDEWRFSTTLLHETGHVLLMMLIGDREVPARQIASIPHSTASLSDRTTAFSEGFAIHL